MNRIELKDFIVQCGLEPIMSKRRKGELSETKTVYMMFDLAEEDGMPKDSQWEFVESVDHGGDGSCYDIWFVFRRKEDGKMFVWYNYDQRLEQEYLEETLKVTFKKEIYDFEQQYLKAF